MGWFWDSSPSPPAQQDPYKSLDPKLKDFLAQGPSSSSAAASTPTSSTAEQLTTSSTTGPDHYRVQAGLTQPARTSALSQHDTTNTPTEPNTTSVPPESLYQDGRYAHLWRTYIPDTTGSDSGPGTSDQDRLASIMDTYHSRQAAISRAALENCVLWQLEEKNCFDTGGWYAKMTMCRDESRQFRRCFEMQGRFLRALGYMGSELGPPRYGGGGEGGNGQQQEIGGPEERIQMHADRLYTEMLAREAAVKEAKEKGVQEPTFAPLLSPRTVGAAVGVQKPARKSAANVEKEGPSASASAPATISTPATNADAQSSTTPAPTAQDLSIFPPERRKQIELSLAKKTPVERDLEIQLLVAEKQAGKEYSQQVQQFYEDERAARTERREQGKETFGDTIKRYSGWT